MTTYVERLPVDVNRMVLSYLLPILSAEGQLIKGIGMENWTDGAFFERLLLKTARYIGLITGNPTLQSLVVFLFDSSNDPDSVPEKHIIYELYWLLYFSTHRRLIQVLLIFGLLDQYERIGQKKLKAQAKALQGHREVHWNKVSIPVILYLQEKNPQLPISLKCALQHNSIPLYHLAVQQGFFPWRFRKMLMRASPEMLEIYLRDLPRVNFKQLTLAMSRKPEFLDLLVPKLELPIVTETVNLYVILGLTLYVLDRTGYLQLREQLFELLTNRLTALEGGLHRLIFHLLNSKIISVKGTKHIGWTIPLSPQPELILWIYQVVFSAPYLHPGTIYHLLSVTPPSLYPSLRPLVRRAIQNYQLQATRWIRAHLLN